MLHIALSHNRRFSSTCAGIQRNVLVEVKTKTLTPIKSNNQFTSPPSVAEGQICRTVQYEQCLPGVGLTAPFEAALIARFAVRIRS